MDPLAFVTMVRDDHAMLRKWVAHHARQVEDRRSLYIVAHGEDAEIARIAAGCSFMVVPFHSEGKNFEPARRQLFWGLVRALKGYHEFVVTLDVDEFLVLDPLAGGRLEDRLRGHPFKGVALSPLGIEVIHKPSAEPSPAPLEEPVLGPRRYGMLQGQYCKPCIFRAPPPRGGTQHELQGQAWDIDTALILFHLRFYDRDFAEAQSRRRLSLFEQFEAHGQDHAVGGWQKRIEIMDRIMGTVEAHAPKPLTTEVAQNFVHGQCRAYEERGLKLNWRKSAGDVVHIPERFVGLV